MKPGNVYLVGAGPGDPELLTIRGYQALLAADVVLIDQLLPVDYLQRLAIPVVGKMVRYVSDGPLRWSQSKICEQLAHHALAGKMVVRLKGGDPCVFGRGSDELNYLAARGIACELVPGLSSVSAIPTSAGLPLTRHAQARSFAIVTARLVSGAIQDDFPRSDTLVIVMGIAVLQQVVGKLLADGWPPDTPITIVERGALHWERRIASNLEHVVALQQRSRLAAPALIVVGDAAHGIRCLNERPSVLFTGLDPSSFRGLGNLLHWPALHIVPVEESCQKIGSLIDDLTKDRFDSVLFTDKLGVDSFFLQMRQRNADARIFTDTVIMCSNEMVARRLQWHGLFADVVGGESGVKLLHPRKQSSSCAEKRGSVLVMSGTHVPRRLAIEMEKTGCAAELVLLNTLESHPDLGRHLPDHDAIYFVSPAGVKAYHDVYGNAAFTRSVWCLGHATRETLAEYGVEAKVVVPQRLMVNEVNSSRDAVGMSVPVFRAIADDLS